MFGERPQPLVETIDEHPATCGTAAWEALPHLEALLTRAREAQVPVVHTTGDVRAGAILGAATKRSRLPGEDDAVGYEIIGPLRPVDGEIVVRKSRASAFFGTPLSTWLRQLDVDTVVVGGETTSGCVRATVVDAYSYGFRVAVVEEATFDRSTLSHKVNLFDLNLKYASVLHLDTVLGYLDGTGPVECGEHRQSPARAGTSPGLGAAGVSPATTGRT